MCRFSSHIELFDGWEQGREQVKAGLLFFYSFQRIAAICSTSTPSTDQYWPLTCSAWKHWAEHRFLHKRSREPIESVEGLSKGFWWKMFPACVKNTLGSSAGGRRRVGGGSPMVRRRSCGFLLICSVVGDVQTQCWIKTVDVKQCRWVDFNPSKFGLM